MRKLLKTFLSNQRGAVAIVAAISIPVAAGLVAATVDYSNAVYQRSKAQDALDSAALGYIQTYLMNGNENVARATANDLFRANVTDDRWVVNIGPIRESNGELKVEGRAHKHVQPFMLQAIGVNNIDLAVNAEARLGIRAISAVLVPDVSHSMRGNHLNAAKRAMQSFGDTMFRLPHQFTHRMHIAVAPYAGSVNVQNSGWGIRQLLRGWEYSSDGARPFNHKHHYSDQPGCSASVVHRFTEHLHNSGHHPQFRVQEWAWEEVQIIERETYWEEDDEGERVERSRDRVRYEWQCVDKGIVRQQNWSGCLQTTRGEFNPAVTLRAGNVAPLPPTTHQSDGPHCPSGRSAMRAGFRSGHDFRSYVGGLDTGFSTAHDIGLLWGARFLEPAWAPALGVPNYPWNREDEFPKYLVFMSDGASVDVGYNFGDYVGRNRDEINRNVRYICDYLKARGVTIFGIYYLRDVRPEGIDTVRGCASRDRFYQANITSVEGVFSDIATRIVSENLRLSR